MAAAPWRCSQCGTINEPAASSCRTCGRWPSLFDLQESVVDEAAGSTAVAGEPEPVSFEPEPFEAETYRTDTYEPVPVEDVPAAEGEAPESAGDRRRRVITSLLVPLAFVVYVLISIFFGDRGSG